MNFNPFDKNNLPSVSMFAKEKQKPIQAAAEVVEDLKERFVVKEYLGVKMDYETRTFFNEIVDQIGEEEALMKIVNNGDTRINDSGTLTKLYCVGTRITSLPELPAGLAVLSCSKTQITSLPELPASLTELNCSRTQITSLPNLPAGLTRLDCSYTQITSLPNLPAGLTTLYCSGTPFAPGSVAVKRLRELYPNIELII